VLALPKVGDAWSGCCSVGPPSVVPPRAPARPSVPPSLPLGPVLPSLRDALRARDPGTDRRCPTVTKARSPICTWTQTSPQQPPAINVL